MIGKEKKREVLLQTTLDACHARLDSKAPPALSRNDVLNSTSTTIQSILFPRSSLPRSLFVTKIDNKRQKQRKPHSLSRNVRFLSSKTNVLCWWCGSLGRETGRGRARGGCCAAEVHRPDSRHDVAADGVDGPARRRQGRACCRRLLDSEQFDARAVPYADHALCHLHLACEDETPYQGLVPPKRWRGPFE